MTPLISGSVGNINVIPGTSFIQSERKDFFKHYALHNYAKRVFFTRGFDFSRHSSHWPKIFRISFTHFHGLRNQSMIAVGTDSTKEDQNFTVSGEVKDEAEGLPPISVEISKTASRTPQVTPSARIKRPRPVKKSEMPPVKDEELIPGSSFIGKVRSIQPFGAFIDFGAFTEGLVHISQISDEFVTDISSAVSVGQEVKVKVVEASKETGRISLSMRDSVNTNKKQHSKEMPTGESSDKPRSGRKRSARYKREDGEKDTVLVKGQILDGTVKNIISSGSFISLPDGKEGFLPVSEESEGFESLKRSSSLQVGQEIEVRVLRVYRGQVTLTKKKEIDLDEINRQLNQDITEVAKNAFEEAFRKNKGFAAFFDQMDREKNSHGNEEKVNESSVTNEGDSISVSSRSALGSKLENSISEVLRKEDSTSKFSLDEQINQYAILESESHQRSISRPDTLTETEDNSKIPAKSSDLVSHEICELDQLTSSNALSATKDFSISSATDLALENSANSDALSIVEGNESDVPC